MAVSWNPTPVRSQIVICIVARPARLPAGHHFAQLRPDVRLAQQPGGERVRQFAEPRALR